MLGKSTLKEYPRARWRLVLATIIVGTVLVSSCAPNNPPVISSLQSEHAWVELSSSSKVNCVASDLDEDELTYQWSTTGGEISGQGATVTWTGPNTPGTYAITVKVTDDRGGEATTQLTIEVRANHPPVIESLTADLTTLRQAETTPIECIASDPDGDELTYQWEASGGEISEQGATVFWKAPDASGDYTVRVTVADGRASRASNELTIIVEAEERCG